MTFQARLCAGRKLNVDNSSSGFDESGGFQQVK
ncbi:hypothetical protein CBNA_1478 [Coxiella burnetii str. Namibia]|nr:hypothetical protein CBNA_1478 [Coxiella burnetii str. Namibia]